MQPAYYTRLNAVFAMIKESVVETAGETTFNIFVVTVRSEQCNITYILLWAFLYRVKCTYLELASHSFRGSVSKETPQLEGIPDPKQLNDTIITAA